MEKNVHKGMKLSMGTKNGIVSTALLSLLFEKNKKDNLDLLRPFVECAICAKYSVGDKIDIATVASHLEAEFGFENVVDSVVESILERLVKEKYVSQSYHAFFYEKNLNERCDKFSSKREIAKQLLNTITANLRKVFVTDNLQSLKDEDIHNILYEYFEQYGLNLFNKRIPAIKSNNKNPYLFSIANYIIEEEKKNSAEFLDIVQLYKGVLLSSVIYIQPENSDLYYARFKNTTVYLDAPMVLRILGLCSDVDNRRGIQFYNLLKGKVSFKIFEHSYNELCGILLAYRKNRKLPYRSTNTLAYFDKKKYSDTDISNYYTMLPQTLNKLGIMVDSDSSQSIDRLTEEYSVLRTKLKNTISFYETHEPALEYDTKSIFSISLKRGEKAVTAIENCGAIFVTMNKSLAIVALEWQSNEMSSVPLVISDTDLSVIMWLKEYKSRQDFPKDFIVANAFGTLEAISDSFVEQLSEKVIQMEDAGELSPADVSLVLENLYIQRKLFDTAKGDIESVTETDIIELRDNYKVEYAKEIGMDNEKLTTEKLVAEETIEKMTQEQDRRYNAMISVIKKQAQEYAISSTRWIPVCKWITIVALLALFVVLAVIEICLSQPNSVFLIVACIISGVFGVLGMIDAVIPMFKYVEKFRKKLISNKYASKFSQLLQEYEEEVTKNNM